MSINNIYSSLKEAAKAAQKLGIKSAVEYKHYYKEDMRLPYNPRKIFYKDWETWSVFLGQSAKYSSLQEHAVAAKRLNIKSKFEYRRRYKEDSRLSSEPHIRFFEEWESWAVFLGREEKYASLQESAEAAQKLGIRSRTEYRNRYKENVRLYFEPHTKFSEEWESWPVFLGMQNKIVLYDSLKEASKAAQKLGISSSVEYRHRHNEDAKLPCQPKIEFSGEWESWAVFLGREEKYASLQESAEAAQKLGFTNAAEYQRNYKYDPRLYFEPQIKFSEEWESWAVFLGQGKLRDIYSSLMEASGAAQKLGIRSHTEYRHRYREDARLPFNPQIKFSEEWEAWPVFLAQDANYASLQETSKVAQKLGISSSVEYRHRHKEDARLSSEPQIKFSAEWEGWPLFLGQEEKYPSLKETAAAAQKLGIRNAVEYRNRYKEDVRLYSEPQRKFSEEWEAWSVFLGQEVIYASLQEASKAAQKLGISSYAEYRRRHKEDVRLPCDPQKKFSREWESWTVFLGKKVTAIYLSLKETAAAAQKLGIRNPTEYRHRYKEDNKLPCQPIVKFSKEWESWPIFLGIQERAIYSSLKEASKSSRKLGITSAFEYQKHYKKDSRLPSDPQNRYSDGWEGWAVFLGQKTKGLYPSLQEAALAARNLGIRSFSEYVLRYKEDERLHSNPQNKYSEDWEEWPIFLNVVQTDRFDPLVAEYPILVEACRKFIDISVNQSSKTSSLFYLLVKFFGKNGIPDGPAILHRDTFFNARKYEAFVHDTGETQKRSRHNICVSFMDFMLELYCTEEDDDGEQHLLPGYRNPLKTALNGLLDQLQTSRPSESTKPVLPLNIIERAREYLIPSKAKSLSDIDLERDIFSADWMNVDEGEIDKNDPNCVWRQYSAPEGGAAGKRYREGSFQIFCPVRLIANYLLFTTILRGQQILWLDSGEGDEYIPILECGELKWKKNSSFLSVKKRNQGFVQKGENDAESMYVTTNKTGKKVGGYFVPWMPENVSYWVMVLRDWQIKYNPLNELTAWTDIKLRQKTNKKILQARGVQAFLFRDPISPAIPSYSPMKTVTAFARNFAEILFNTQVPGEDIAKKVKRYGQVVIECDFTPHSMRTSLITAYIVDGKAPVHIISKLVGHSSIVMTIYYTKVGQETMRSELAKAEKRALKSGISHLQDRILNKKISEARSELIATDKTCFDMDWPISAYQFMDRGICPMSGGGCSEGGELLVDRSTELTYAPVPQGYLGKRNCIRCRFFITGPAFLGGLTSLVNEIGLEIESVRQEYHYQQTLITQLEDEKYDCEINDTLFKNRNELMQAVAAYESKAEKLDMLICDWQSTHGLVRQSIALLNNQSSDHKKQLIVNKDFIEIGYQFEDYQTNFKLLASICQDAEIYSTASASRAAPLLSNMLDTLADNNGLAPAMYKLDECQKVKVGNQIVGILMDRLNGDWHEAERIVQGDILLADLNQEESLIPIKEEIQKILNGTVSYRLENDDV